MTTQLRSPTDWGFFISLRYSHSQKKQPATETAVSVRARRPNFMHATSSAGSMAMITSSMMDRVVSWLRIWGEDVAISLRFL